MKKISRKALKTFTRKVFRLSRLSYGASLPMTRNEKILSYRLAYPTYAYMDNALVEIFKKFNTKLDKISIKERPPRVRRNWLRRQNNLHFGESHKK